MDDSLEREKKITSDMASKIVDCIVRFQNRIPTTAIYQILLGVALTNIFFVTEDPKKAMELIREAINVAIKNKGNIR